MSTWSRWWESGSLKVELKRGAAGRTPSFCWWGDSQIINIQEHVITFYEMDANREWLEAVLKKRAHEESPVQVLEFEAVPNAMGAGVNFQSKISLIKSQVLLGSGKTRKLTLIVKDQHDTDPMRMMSVQLGVFTREIVMYRDILPKMEDLLEGISDTEGKFWPTCYDVRLYDRLVLEDLRDSGYRTPGKKEMLGLEAALLTIQNIGKFHAMSRVLLDRGEIPGDVFRSHPFDNAVAATFLGPMLDQNVAKFICAVEKWGDEWKSAVEKLKKLENFTQIFMDLIKVEPDEFAVLGHGDCWLNNILFKGDDLQHPSSVRFIDFQQSFISSPATDLTHFLVASVKLETREQHLDDILQSYHGSLASCLEKCGREGPIPTLDDVKAALKKRGLMQLWFSIALVPTMQEAVETPELSNISPEVLEEVMKGGAMPAEFDVFNSLDPRTVNLLKTELKRAITNGDL